MLNSESIATFDRETVIRQEALTAPARLYRLTRQPDGSIVTANSEPVGAIAQTSSDEELPSTRDLFTAEQRADGTYSVSLTETGMQRLETALGFAEDFGRDSKVSPHSSIADLMERGSVRDELGLAMRQSDGSLPSRFRIAVLRRRFTGSERPTREQCTISHLGKLFIVGLVAYWAVQQLGIAFADIQAIPGILANIPSDLLNLDPSHSIDQAGGNINDAYVHFLFAGFGAVATYVVSKLVKPLQRIYRRDQLVPGERQVMGMTAALTSGARRLQHVAE